MVYWPSNVIAIVSPLLGLMEDQHQKLVNADIPHVVLSSDSSDDIDSNLMKRIVEGEYRAVFMSPEIIFGDSPTSKLVQGLWQDERWQKQLLAIVVDEVHCIKKWGGNFRPAYGRLGELRIWSPGVPFVGVSATLTASELTQTKDKLFLSNVNVVRVQDVPGNIRLEIHTQQKDAKLGLSHTKFKNTTMSKFVKSDLQVLLATEAAGMGCDISDVVQVIQYG
ncbi:hypothetical protein BGZ82_002235 [Podila clonocystis]|nr:hypothetical protein BGZ82_002235 [Podila clonocystis]